MSDLVQFVLDNIPGSRVVETRAVQAPSGSRERRKCSGLFSAEFDEKTKKKRDCPYGLATGGNNWLENHKMSESIKFGVVDQKAIINDFKKAFLKYDALISPTSPTTAFKIGDKIDDPLMMYLSDICTIPVNLAGIPAISLPSGISESGLPIGVQVIGDFMREDNVIKIASAIESEIKWKIRPQI